jgi:hypothetical protein
MTPGLGIFLIALGAIIRYAIDISIAGVEEGTIGLILMLAGLAVLLFWVISLIAARRDPAYDRRGAADPRYRA